MKPASQVKVHDSVIEGLDSMSDEEDEHWGITGAFPGSSPLKSSPSNSGGMDGTGKKSNANIFVDEAFQGSHESLEIVAEGSRETNTSSSQEGLMALSHSSSETPAMSNTAVAVRDLLKKNQIQSMNSGGGGGGGGGGKSGFYPFNIYRSLSNDQRERLENEEKQNYLQSKTSAAATASPTLVAATLSSMSNDLQTTNKMTSTGRKDRSSRNASAAPTPPPPPLEDETSSVITDEHHQDHSQYLDGGSSLQDHQTMSVISHRRPKGGNRQYWTRHALPSSQQVAANPASLLKNLFIGIEAERQMHRLTALHLRAIHNWFLFLPAILLTLSAGLVVLVFEADLQTNSDARVYASISVGVASLVSVVWQALSKELDMGTRATLHDTTSIALKRLSEDILLTLSATENIPAEYVSLIGEKASQAIDSCTSRVPIKLDAAFSAMSDRMILMLRPPMGQAPRKYVHNKLDFIRLYTTAYDELSAEIINYVAFPFFIPSPRVACDAALRSFKTIITEGRDVEGRRQHCIKCVCPCFGTPDEERSLFDVLPTVAVFEPAGGTSSSYPIRNSMLGTSV